MPIELLYVVGLLCIAGAMGYALIRSRRISAKNKAISEEATRRSYDDPEGYAKGGEQRLRGQTEPDR